MPRKKHHEPEPLPAVPMPDLPLRDPANEQAAAGKVYTIPQLCERWQASRHTLHKAMREGRLKAFRLGERTWRVSEAEVLRYEQQNMAAAS